MDYIRQRWRTNGTGNRNIWLVLLWRRL